MSRPLESQRALEWVSIHRLAGARRHSTNEDLSLVE
ncbi:unannotated protein [freshwater metagenome]|uniref:Unannotated protein n=1 Tax=freshwater metagenome TaxID=449393 RepID=A0A6J6SC36_9ZZZZ